MTLLFLYKEQVHSILGWHVMKRNVFVDYHWPKAFCIIIVENNIHKFVLIHKRIVHSSLGWKVAKECFKELPLAEGHNIYNIVVIHHIGRRPCRIY